MMKSKQTFGKALLAKLFKKHAGKSAKNGDRSAPKNRRTE